MPERQLPFSVTDRTSHPSRSVIMNPEHLIDNRIRLVRAALAPPSPSTRAPRSPAPPTASPGRTPNPVVPSGINRGFTSGLGCGPRTGGDRARQRGLDPGAPSYQGKQGVTARRSACAPERVHRLDHRAGLIEDDARLSQCVGGHPLAPSLDMIGWPTRDAATSPQVTNVVLPTAEAPAIPDVGARTLVAGGDRTGTGRNFAAGP